MYSNQCCFDGCVAVGDGCGCGGGGSEGMWNSSTFIGCFVFCFFICDFFFFWFVDAGCVINEYNDALDARRYAGGGIDVSAGGSSSGSGGGGCA